MHSHFGFAYFGLYQVELDLETRSVPLLIPGIVHSWPLSGKPVQH